MINNLQDLQDLFLRHAAKAKNNSDMMSSNFSCPGISNGQKVELVKLGVEFPSSYVNVIEKYNVYFVDLSWFSLSPHPFGTKDLIDCLNRANCQDPFFPKEFMEKHRMYQIGSYNTDLVCVTAGTGQFKEGEILFVEEGYDIYNPQDDQIHPLAKDFEQFLIVAGNLNEIHREIKEDNSNWEEKKNEFIERLRLLGVDENYHKAWLNVF